MNFRISSRVFEKMQALVDKGEYEDISDVIVSALHQLLEESENRDLGEETVNRFLDSDDGREMIRKILLAECQKLNLPGRLSEIPKTVPEPEPESPKKIGKKPSVKVRLKKNG